MITINYLAVLVSGFASIALGSLWYGPLFGKKWIALSGITKQMTDKAKPKDMIKAYVLSFVGALLTAYILSHYIVFANAYFDKSGALAGATSGFWAWLGFVAPMTMGMVRWEGKSWKLWLINNGYNLVFLLVAGMILGAWA